MKRARMSSVGLVALLGAVVGVVLFPVLSQGRPARKRRVSDRTRRDREREARVEKALEACRRSGPPQMAEVGAVIQGLPPNDGRRWAFAALLAGRGRVQEAYEAARPRARFGEFRPPLDGEMEAYARLAERAGHPQEAAWARERVGIDGHFRVWMRGGRHAFAQRRVSNLPAGRSAYAARVNARMDDGLALYPWRRAEIEALRSRLLTGS